MSQTFAKMSQNPSQPIKWLESGTDEEKFKRFIVLWLICHGLYRQWPSTAWSWKLITEPLTNRMTQFLKTLKLSWNFDLHYDANFTLVAWLISQLLDPPLFRVTKSLSCTLLVIILAKRIGIYWYPFSTFTVLISDCLVLIAFSCYDIIPRLVCGFWSVNIVITVNRRKWLFHLYTL